MSRKRSAKAKAGRRASKRAEGAKDEDANENTKGKGLRSEMRREWKGKGSESEMRTGAVEEETG